MLEFYFLGLFSGQIVMGHRVTFSEKKISSAHGKSRFMITMTYTRSPHHLILIFDCLKPVLFGTIQISRATFWAIFRPPPPHATITFFK